MNNSEHHDRCPKCGRKFKSIRDFPRVLVLRFERLPVPEAVDRMSGEAVAKQLARKKRTGDTLNLIDDGINRTPEIAALCAQAAVQNYLDSLSKAVGQIVEPASLKPPFEPSRRFKGVHSVPETKLFLSLTEEDRQDASKGIAIIEVYCDGPNMGSAGGPTLLALGAIGRLHYQGLLL